MTARELYTYALIENNKVEAPSMLLEDYIYLINKVVQQYTNKVYNRFDINQQSTDDLRVLQTDTIISDIVEIKVDFVKRSKILLPSDYLHLLSCTVEFEKINAKPDKCGNEDGNTIMIGCKKANMDNLPQIINNYYMCPSYDNPYYLITNSNTQSLLPTNPTMDSQISPILGIGEHRNPKDVLSRLSNQSDVFLEILFGKKDNWEVKNVYISYLKSPMYIELTEEQLDTIEDTSQIIEFPDYVCYEIINEFAKLLLENSSDPRLQTHLPVNQTIMTAGSVQ